MNFACGEALLARHLVDQYAFNSQIGRDKAERDVILSYALKILDEQAALEGLAFKGGTCLRKTLFGGTGRFSMDLDFTCPRGNYGDLQRTMRKILNDKAYYGISFKLSGERSETSGDVLSYRCDVAYSHGWNSDAFKLEVSLRESPVLDLVRVELFPEAYWKRMEFRPFILPCLRSEELLAEKIRAAIERTRSRDLFDLYLFSQRSYKHDAVKQLVIEKTWNSGTIFDPKQLFRKIERGEYDWDDLESLVPPRRLPAKRTLIKAVRDHYSYLRNLDAKLVRIAEDARRHRHRNEIMALRKSIRSGLA